MKILEEDKDKELEPIDKFTIPRLVTKNGILGENDLYLNSLYITKDNEFILNIQPGFFILDNIIYYLYDNLQVIEMTEPSGTFFISGIDLFSPIVIHKTRYYASPNDIPAVPIYSTYKNQYNLSGIKYTITVDDIIEPYTFELKSNEYSYTINEITISGINISIYTSGIPVSSEDPIFVYYNGIKQPYLYYTFSQTTSPLYYTTSFLSIVDDTTTEGYIEGYKLHVVDAVISGNTTILYLLGQNKDGSYIENLNDYISSTPTGTKTMLDNSYICKLTINSIPDKVTLTMTKLNYICTKTIYVSKEGS